MAEENINNKPGDEHLYVTVTRVDDLVDDNGSILAERVMAVRVTFDVIENQIHCNGVPIEIGVSNIQVQVQMASDTDKLTLDSPEELSILEDSFDVGLATVEVTATLLDEMITPDGITFRRIAVQEKITEINNEKVIQTEAGQQVLDIFENGESNKWSVDPVTGFLLPNDGDNKHLDDSTQQDTTTPPAFLSNNNNSNGCAAILDPIVQWWNDQSNLVRGSITGALCALFFGMALFIRHLILSANRAYEALPHAVYVDDMDDDADNEVIYKQDHPPAYDDNKDEPEKQPFLA